MPIRDYRFGPQHIPLFLPADWYDPHFQDLTGLRPSLLRRLAAIKLVQLTQGGSHEAASQQLGLPPRREFAATGRRQKTSAQLLTDWGESKRLAASVLVWTRVTHGEHFFAPLVLEEQRRSGRRRLASLASRVAHGSRVGRPEHHHARLMTASHVRNPLLAN